MRTGLVLVTFATFFSLFGCASTPVSRNPIDATDDWVLELLRSDLRLATVACDATEDRLQILVSEVVLPPGDTPAKLSRHGFRLDREYFYPASTIKLFAALGVLEWLAAAQSSARERGSPVLQLNTPLRIHPLFEDEVLEERDASNLDGGTITLGHEIRKLCIVSDNVAFNRLYGVLGRDDLNRRAARAGFSSLRCLHRLAKRRTLRENALSPRIDFLVTPRSAVANLRLPMIPLEPVPPAEFAGSWVGQAHLADGARVEGPMDFREKNRVSIRDLQDAMITTLRPDLVIGKPGYELAPEHRAFLATALRQLPRESENPKYDPEKYSDDWVKFLLPGLRRVVPAADLDVFAKVGLAYGFTVVNSYVVDRGSGRSFFVTGCLYTNPNGTVNDGVYGYDEIALPFWADLGEVLARKLLRPARVDGDRVGSGIAPSQP